MNIGIDSLDFRDLKYNSRGETITSVDKTGEYLLKIQVVRNSRKIRDIDGEFKIMQLLNERGCVSCPTAHVIGTLERQYLIERGVEIKSEEPSFRYTIQDYVPSKDNYSMSDLVFSIIEQKKLGIYQGDIKPENVRFDPETGVCFLIDYDQALDLTSEQSAMSNLDFFNFCDIHDKNHYGFGNWLRHYSNYDRQNFSSLFVDGALDLSMTSVFRMQKTTNTTTGFYHTVKTPDVFINGSRGISDRAAVMDAIEFSQGEKVLDVGCNAGLLCEYLSDRGCSAYGVDNDPHIIIAAKMISNVTGRNIKYACADLDFVESIGQFDTVMLFSVFHHTRNPGKNAKKIASACKRIIIETRLTENGKQPVNGQWVDTTKWSFETLGQLTAFLESTFTGFRYTKNLGGADKGRYILELVKQ